MTSATCIINIFGPRLDLNSHTIQMEIRDFLAMRKGCKVVGFGRSCRDFSYSDIEVRFRSEVLGNRTIDDLRAAFSERCEIDIDWF